MQAEKALQKSEEKYRNIVHTANERNRYSRSIWNSKYLNAKIAGMLGYSSDELIGTEVLYLL